MIIRVSRKELNEKEDYAISIEENDYKEVISSDDVTVIELMYEILNNKD